MPIFKYIIWEPSRRYPRPILRRSGFVEAKNAEMALEEVSKFRLYKTEHVSIIDIYHGKV